MVVLFPEHPLRAGEVDPDFAEEMAAASASGFTVGLYRHESVVAGDLPSPCTVADALEAGWIAEACTTSLQQHRPVRMEEVRT